MAKRRRFKDPAMQETYDNLRSALPATVDLDRLKGANAGLNCYVIGYRLPDEPTRLARRDTRAYACWAAGVDNRRDAGRR